MTSTRRLILAAVTGVTVILGAAAFAQAGHRDHGPGHGPWSMGSYGMGGMHKALEQLDLSPEQKETIRGIFEQARPQFQAVHEQMRANAEKLMDADPGDANYSTVVNEVSQAAAEIAAGLVQQMSQVRTQIHGVLTPEQKAKLPAIRAEMKTRMQERRELRRERMEQRRQPAPASNEEA